MALLAGQKRCASATARQKTVLLRISVQQFDKLIKDNIILDRILDEAIRVLSESNKKFIPEGKLTSKKPNPGQIKPLRKSISSHQVDHTRVGHKHTSTVKAPRSAYLKTSSSSTEKENKIVLPALENKTLFKKELATTRCEWLRILFSPKKWIEKEDAPKPICAISLSEVIRGIFPETNAILDRITINGQIFHDASQNTLTSKKEFYEKLFMALYQAGLDSNKSKEEVQKEVGYLLNSKDVKETFCVTTEERVFRTSTDEYLHSHPIPCLPLLRAMCNGAWFHADAIFRQKLLLFPFFISRPLQGFSCDIEIDPKTPSKYAVTHTKIYGGYDLVQGCYKKEKFVAVFQIKWRLSPVSSQRFEGDYDIEVIPSEKFTEDATKAIEGAEKRYNELKKVLNEGKETLRKGSKALKKECLEEFLSEAQKFSNEFEQAFKEKPGLEILHEIANFIKAPKILAKDKENLKLAGEALQMARKAIQENKLDLFIQEAHKFIHCFETLLNQKEENAFLKQTAEFPKDPEKFLVEAQALFDQGTQEFQNAYDDYTKITPVKMFLEGKKFLDQSQNALKEGEEFLKEGKGLIERVERAFKP